MIRTARSFDGCVNISIGCGQNRFQSIYFNLRTVEVASINGIRNGIDGNDSEFKLERSVIKFDQLDENALNVSYLSKAISFCNLRILASMPFLESEFESNDLNNQFLHFLEAELKKLNLELNLTEGALSLVKQTMKNATENGGATAHQLEKFKKCLKRRATLRNLISGYRKDLKIICIQSKIKNLSREEKEAVKEWEDALDRLINAEIDGCLEPEIIKAQAQCLLRVRALNDTIDKCKEDLDRLCIIGAQV